MSVKPLDAVCSVGFGILAICTTHGLLFIAACPDLGVTIESEAGVCIHVYKHEPLLLLKSSLPTLYFFLGLIASLASVLMVKKIRGHKGG